MDAYSAAKLIAQFGKIESIEEGKYFVHRITFPRLSVEQIRENARALGIDPDLAVRIEEAAQRGDCEFEIGADGRSVVFKNKESI